MAPHKTALGGISNVVYTSSGHNIKWNQVLDVHPQHSTVQYVQTNVIIIVLSTGFYHLHSSAHVFPSEHSPH